MDQRTFLTSQGLSIKLTASIGLAAFPEHASTALDLLRAADEAMYRVKARGRNGLLAAGEDPPPLPQPGAPP
jgi:diguanylate cyclase (GGDEF)-like protein